MNMVIFDSFLYVYQRLLPLDSCSFGNLMYPKDGSTLVSIGAKLLLKQGKPLENHWKMMVSWDFEWDFEWDESLW